MQFPWTPAIVWVSPLGLPCRDSSVGVSGQELWSAASLFEKTGLPAYGCSRPLANMISWDPRQLQFDGLIGPSNARLHLGATVKQSARQGKPSEQMMTPGAKPLLGAAVIVHDTSLQRVVLLQRGSASPFGQGLWDLPSGKSLPGEPVTQTAVRELDEETGLHVDTSALMLAHVVHSSWGATAPYGYVTVIFAAQKWRGIPENREPGKHAQVRWMSIFELPEPFISTNAHALYSYLAGDSDVTIDGWA